MLLHLIKRGALPPLRRGCSSVAPSSLSLRPIVPSELSDATIGAIPPSRIRNFCIIAHVDHGKSTLADRLMQLAGNISSEKMGEGQVLDKLQVERERGITVKSQTVSMFYDGIGIGGIGDGDGDGDNEGEGGGEGGGDGGSGSGGEGGGREGGGDGRYMLNLIDTPGHVDFSSEVAQSLLACQGALLLVDASQGVQAQTLATYNSAVAAGIEIIPVLTKTDLPHSNPERAIDQLFMAMDVDPDFVIQTSAKSGIGVDLLPAAIVERLPPPPAASVTAASVAAFLSEHPTSTSASSSSSASLSSPSFDLVERAERNSTGSDVPHVSSSSFVYDRIARPRTNATCGALRQILGILRTPGFTVIVLGLSALFFVVTGVQFWATDFLISVMNGNKYTVMLLFVATSATAPVAGVAFGGWVIDRCAGGFRGANRPKALRLVTLLGVLANFAGWVGGWYDSKSIYFVVGCIWLLLFFGAACLPPLTGMYMDAVPDKRLKVRTGQSEGGGTRERGEGSGE